MHPPLRILALNWRDLSHPQGGGSEINRFEQANQWAANGHEVTIFRSGPGPCRGYLLHPAVFQHENVGGWRT